jgi:hypothetical protein
MLAAREWGAAMPEASTMKHVFLLVLLLAGCSLDDPEAEPAAANSQGTIATATTPSSANAGTAATSPGTPSVAVPPTIRTPTQPSAAGASAMSTQPAVAGANAAAPPTQPPAAGASTPVCEVLARCCPALSDQTLRATCEGVATARAEAACAQITPMLCTTDNPSTTTSSCDTLATCCATLEDEDQEDCQSAVDEADPAACDEAQAELCPAATTPPGTATDDCPKLMICCTSLTDDEDQEECLEVVADADAAACGESLAELCPDPNAPPPPESDD